jgi:purine-binding chemotaxis protein CheW
LPVESLRNLVVFQLAGNHTALPLESVDRIEPMAALARPPGLPAPLEGVLNAGGTAVPVLRLDRLLQLPERQQPGLYSMLIILKEVSEAKIAILADRVSEVVSVPASALLPVGDEDCFNSCAQAILLLGDRRVHLLSPARILLEREREVLREFRAMEQHRMTDWQLGAM